MSFALTPAVAVSIALDGTGRPVQAYHWLEHEERAMHGRHPLALAALPAMIALSGCGSQEQAEPAPVETAAATGRVVREQVPAAPAAIPPPAIRQAAIRTQPGPKESQVALNKVAVTGDILTVQLTYTGGSGWHTPSLKDVSVIDDATAQRIGVLKDGEGNYLASPLNGGVKYMLGFKMGEGPQIVWFKFPAPPATSKTISINIPDVVPFDGVTVMR